MDAETKELLKKNAAYFGPQIAWQLIVVGIAIYCWTAISAFLDVML